MKQKATIHLPKLNTDGKPVTDKYGKAIIAKSITTKARVQFKSQIVKDPKGREHEVAIEIDVPPGINPKVGTDIGYVTVGGSSGEGTIRAKEEATNLAGTKVYYRTVFVDG
ncbi:hypothetical protein GMD78_12295 [Ornithinibacillus sp. L9]|uniref:Uncharacterized protein n=1 Tax=Ornithinibacillus caprae TaxID=2678566 RepID=A0A6N8FI97_9BACI|nr:hypothetical protein [Ornithinibacillus caprae]MUK89153.1 hypothetical protein [Ornithinibacillus caprae]